MIVAAAVAVAAADHHIAVGVAGNFVGVHRIVDVVAVVVVDNSVVVRHGVAVDRTLAVIVAETIEMMTKQPQLL